MHTFAHWISLPENRSAQNAVERVADRAGARRPVAGLNPLFLHGPAGTGKSHLVAALRARVVQQAPDRIISLVTANEFETWVRTHDMTDLRGLRGADFLAVEDVQHLSDYAIESFVQLLDRCLARKQQVVVTANSGPALLTHLPVRLTSRLASGLVVGLEPPSPASRLLLLRAFTARQGLNVAEPVLGWLADHVTGSVRQLEGAVVRLEALTRLQPAPLDVATLAEQFEADVQRPTVERIVARVGHYFAVEPQQLQGPGRSPTAVLPRQIGMYLTHQLTKLSLREIGAYFGGRDHTTVMHACRKVEEALQSDLQMSGAVRQLHAELV